MTDEERRIVNEIGQAFQEAMKRLVEEDQEERYARYFQNLFADWGFSGSKVEVTIDEKNVLHAAVKLRIPPDWEWITVTLKNDQ